MSHHGDVPGDSPIPNELVRINREAIEAFDKKLRKAMGEPLIGATGTHPEGKITPHDEGAIQFAIGVKDGKVCLDFGTPVAWLGMDPGQALELAQDLIKHARNAARGTGAILTLNLG